MPTPYPTWKAARRRRPEAAGAKAHAGAERCGAEDERSYRIDADLGHEEPERDVEEHGGAAATTSSDPTKRQRRQAPRTEDAPCLIITGTFQNPYS